MSKTKTVQVRDPAEIRLDADIIHVMRFAADLQRASSRNLKSLWREKGLSERALFILELVNAGLDRPSRLIEYFDVLPSTITFETDKLVAAGLLTREPLPSDRRVVQLKLTDEGRAMHLETTERLNAWLRPKLASLLPGELDAFLETARKLLDPIPEPGSKEAAEAAGDDRSAA